jgi:hypothetical protein
MSRPCVVATNASEALGYRGGDVLFSVDVDLGAETAAHFRRDRTNPILSETCQCRDEGSEDVRVLRRRPDGHRLLARLEVRDHPAGFHRARREALVHHPLRDDDLGLGERGVDRGVVDGAAVGADAGAARHERDRQVVRERGMDDGRLPGHRELEIHHRRQRIVGDDDGVRGVAGDVAIGRHDDGDRFAGETDGVDGYSAMFRRRKRRADRHGTEELRDLGAREDRFHSVHRLRGAGIDRADASVRDVTALEHDVLHADQRNIVDVGTAAANEARILAPLGALANELR